MQEVTKLPMGKKSQKRNILHLNHVLNVWFEQNNLDNGPKQFGRVQNSFGPTEGQGKSVIICTYMICIYNAGHGWSDT